jgi:hypothetical protein
MRCDRPSCPRTRPFPRLHMPRSAEVGSRGEPHLSVLSAVAPRGDRAGDRLSRIGDPATYQRVLTRGGPGSGEPRREPDAGPPRPSTPPLLARQECPASAIVAWGILSEQPALISEIPATSATRMPGGTWVSGVRVRLHPCHGSGGSRHAPSSRVIEAYRGRSNVRSALVGPKLHHRDRARSPGNRSRSR